MASNVLAWHMWPLKKQRRTKLVAALQTEVIKNLKRGQFLDVFSFDFMVIWGEISTCFWKGDFKDSLATWGAHPLCAFNIHYGQCRNKYHFQELQLKRESVKIWYNNSLAQNILPYLLLCKYLSLLLCSYVVNASITISFTILLYLFLYTFHSMFHSEKILLVSTAKCPSDIWIQNYIIG